MNLIVDIGNSFIKAFVFENNKIIHYQQFKTSENIKEDFMSENLNEIRFCIISAVAEIPDKIMDFCTRAPRKCILLDHETPIPVKNQYKTPQTLGKDRLAAIVGANNIYQRQNVLAIDAGTALTFDFINKNEEYLGGNISPGLNMRFQALNYFTQKLPFLEKQDVEILLGSSTEEAIIAGVQNGVIFETDSYINELKNKYPDLKVILTGGDTFFFEHKLKNTIFAEPNLVAIGLNRILQYNVK